MPLVQVTRDPEKFPDEVLKHLAKVLPPILSKHLSVVQEGEHQNIMGDRDIEVRFHDFGPYDIHKRGLEIVISAKTNPFRDEDLEKRKKLIAYAIRDSLPGGLHEFWIYIQLAHAVFIDIP